MGWRYSPSREAWVHRAMGGRVGPVFRDRDELIGQDSVVDTKLFESVVEARKPKVGVPAEGAAPLPRRAVVVKRPIIPVEAKLHAEEPARVVLVDGRPPRRGIDPRRLRTDDGVVVPIKSARASA